LQALPACVDGFFSMSFRLGRLHLNAPVPRLFDSSSLTAASDLDLSVLVTG